MISRESHLGPAVETFDSGFRPSRASCRRRRLPPTGVHRTGRFTEKSDVYASGVIILQLLSGSERTAAESGRLQDLIDTKLERMCSEAEATQLTKIALDCTSDVPDNRPSVKSVVRDLNEPISVGIQFELMIITYV
ncbi:hypothetical protein C2S53_018913 [Perilla frutescens var. hirtella]|uniref:Serine-threonine/tyrosine-protein kinase catalytic domain-containing protein n=1 Tax=Perilla frutescens var. hirtella TaxID=608512 RepID=A0AAD4NZQ0_PERFH|nr:hypothetical protein C2S53_018913 [Perilla frutescens var. hirtella]